MKNVDELQATERSKNLGTRKWIMLLPVKSTKPNKHNLTSALLRAITQHMVAIPYRYFGTTNRPHLPVSRNTSRNFLNFLTLENVGPIGRPEISVRNYQCTLRNIPENLGKRKCIMLLPAKSTQRNITSHKLSSGLLRSVWWQFLTDVSEQPIGPIFKGQ